MLLLMYCFRSSHGAATANMLSPSLYVPAGVLPSCVFISKPAMETIVSVDSLLFVHGVLHESKRKGFVGNEGGLESLYTNT